MDDTLFSVKGKSALVTGGTGGVGLMIARGLLDAGARVIVCSRSEEKVASARRELSGLGDVTAMVADISSHEGVAAIAETVEQRFDGQLDVLVNNAAVTWGGPIERLKPDVWDRIFDANVKAPFYLTVALLGMLRAAASQSEPARVVNIGSVDAIRMGPYNTNAYSTSKAALHMLTRQMARELAPDAITVNAIALGPFLSSITEFVLGTDEGLAEWQRRVPLGRIGSAEDIAGLTLFLCSRAGAFLTATVIPLDGGYTGCG